MRCAGIMLISVCAAAAMAQSSTSVPASTPTNPAEQKKPAPEAAAKPQPPSAEEKWLYPAQRVSADLEASAANLKRDLHAVAFTTLGSYWWKQDKPAAERWIYPAVDEITIVPQEESDSDRNIRLEAARRVLAIVTPLDPILRERLKDVVSGGTSSEENFFSHSARERTANAFLNSAHDTDPESGERAITESLQFGVTENTVKAITALYFQSPEEAQRLFDTSLSQAIRSTSNSVYEMDIRAFEILLRSPPGGVPDSWRRSTDNAFIATLNNPNYGQSTRCALANELYQSISTPPADLAQTVAANMSLCGSGNSANSDDKNLIERENPQTSDDYLKVAAEAKLASTRYQMKLTAGEKAEEEAKKDESPGPEDGPVKALRILDGMMPDERAVNPAEYKRRREDVAVRASLWIINFGGRLSNCSGGLRVVDNSPRETILHVAIGVAEKIGGGPCYLELMQTTVLRQIDRIPAEDPNDYVRAINLVLRRGPTPADNSLRTILRAMDGWKERDPKLVPRGEVAYSAPWNNLYPLAVVSELFNIPPDTLRAMARGYFRNELLRTDFELLIVKGFLERYAQDLQKEKAESVAEK